MAFTLEYFAEKCREILKADSGPAGRERVCEVVRQALASPEFIAAHVREDAARSADLGVSFSASLIASRHARAPENSSMLHRDATLPV